MAIKQCLNREDVYIHCSCPDFKYRFAYWSTVNNYNSGEPQPSNGKKIRNPNDSLGSGCKHCLLVLNDVGWVIKLASTINNYIKYVEKYYEKQYADIIYPALYGKDYEDAVQLTMFDDEIEDGDNLVTDTDILDKSNDYGRTRTQFKTDAEYGINKPNQVSQGTDVSPNQLSLLDNET